LLYVALFFAMVCGHPQNDPSSMQEIPPSSASSPFLMQQQKNVTQKQKLMTTGTGINSVILAHYSRGGPAFRILDSVGSTMFFVWK
jgi:hypothetical protein